MRRFTDALGRDWDVLVGHASFGTLALLFSRADVPETRSLTLAVETTMAAERELDALTVEELRARLAQSAPWGDDDAGPGPTVVPAPPPSPADGSPGSPGSSA